MNRINTRTGNCIFGHRAISRIAIVLMMSLTISIAAVPDYSYAAESTSTGVAGTVSDTTAAAQGTAASPDTEESASDTEDSNAAASSKAASTAASGTNAGTATESKRSSVLIEAGLSDKDAIKAYGYYKGTNAKKIPVITYHRVVSDKTKKYGAGRGSSLYVSQSTFRQQMKWLKKQGYRTINCQEFRLWYDGKIKLPKKTVLITFDDSRACVAKYAFPVLKKLDMKGTVFTIGHGVVKNEKGSIKKKQLAKLLKKYPNIEFQSHTYDLHKHYGTKGMYKRIKKDAARQRRYFEFDTIAYPYGYSTKEMRKAYKASGIRLGFDYGQNGYATRSQDRYLIRRIKISGVESMNKFKSWFK